MLFSVIVPMYNAAKSIRLCLDSILRQTFDDYEVVIINDGSNDDSESICRDIANVNDKVFYTPLKMEVLVKLVNEEFSVLEVIF